jgi:hypothetical protein
MAYLAIPLFIAFVAAYGCLRLACARARERAGLPARVRVKLPLSWWVFSFLLLGINAVFVFSHSHIAGGSWFVCVMDTAALVIIVRRLIKRQSPFA